VTDSTDAPTATEPPLNPEAKPLPKGVKTGFKQWRIDARAWLREHGFEMWLITGIWAVLTVIIFWLASGHQSPRRYQDEFLFWALAKNFAHGDGLTWRGVDLHMRSWLYPVLISPAFWVSNTVAGAYTAVHLINSMMIVGTLFPAFFMARMFMGRIEALVAALFAVSVAAMNYAGIIGTENLAYLTCTAAFGGIILAAAKPRLRNWIFAFAMMFIAVLTRTQFVLLLPIFFATILTVALMRGPGDRVPYLRSQKWLLGGMLGLFVLGGLAFLIQGKAAVGLYGGVFDGIPLTWTAVKFWVKAFSADIYLLAGIIPVIATLALFGNKENRRDPLIAALLALTVIASLAFIAQVSWFSATSPYDWRARHIFYERYMFYLGPLFFTGLMVSIRRVSVGSAIVSVAVATLIVSGFQTDAVLVPFSYDSFGLSLVGRYMGDNTAGALHIGMLLARVTLALGILYVLSTIPKESVARLFRLGIILLAFGILVAGQVKTWSYAREFSAEAFAGFPKPADFIDKNTDEDVGMIITSTDAPEMYFASEFWNNQITSAWATDAVPFQSPIMYSPNCKFAWEPSGLITGDNCAEPVPNAWYIRNETVSVHFKNETKRVHPAAQYPMLTLIVNKPPSSLMSILSGRNVSNAVVQGTLSAETFLPQQGKLRFQITPAQRPRLIQIGNTQHVLKTNQAGSFVVTIPKDDHTTTLQIKTPTGVADAAAVTGVDVREPGGDWNSIL
jgi:hypothetical protein